MLVLSVKNDNVVSISYEYVYIEDHLKSLLKELNGKGTRH
jgi:hypothetical protein